MFKFPGCLWVYLVFITLTVTNGDVYAQKLKILPAQPLQEKPVGDSMLLTCNPDVQDRNLISELQWRDNKNRIVEKSMYGKPNPGMYTDILPSDPGLTLFISALTEDMGGEYTCTANYASSEPLTATVKIKTFYAIKWIDAPENQYPTINTDYRIRCEVQANPAPSVDWLKNGEPITTSDRFVVESKGLLIRNVEESDDGTYACRAAVISTGQLVTRYIKVEVHIPPTIETLNPIEITEGETANVQCKATGKPPPSYTWIKSSTHQDLSRTDRFSVNKNTGTLVIIKVEQDDHSDYKCVAENAAGKAESKIKIGVLVKPKIYELANITAPEYKDTKIICKASGRPAPMITFQRYGFNMQFVAGVQPSDDRIILEQKVIEAKAETIAILSIAQLKRSDDGLYECIATNKGGVARKNGHVTVEFKPTFENSKNQPPVWTWDNKPGNLSCLAESIPNATIEWRLNDYIIENNANYKIEGRGPRSFLIVNPYNNVQFYAKYKCTASNSLGKADHYIFLKQAFPPNPIQQAKVEVITATTIRFGIVGPAILDGLPVKAFTVQYRKEREFNWDDAKNKTWSIESPYIVEDLVPEQTYTFRFAARNDVGLGAWDGTQQHTMSRRSAPNEPQILSTPVEGIVNSPYADHFELRWQIPADNGEPIEAYQIKFCQIRKVNGEWSSVDGKCSDEEISGLAKPDFRINELRSDTHYKIELRARNAIGYSTPAQLIVKTARGEQYYSYYNACSVCDCHVTLLIFAITSIFSYMCCIH